MVGPYVWYRKHPHCVCAYFRAYSFCGLCADGFATGKDDRSTLCALCLSSDDAWKIFVGEGGGLFEEIQGGNRSWIRIQPSANEPVIDYDPVASAQAFSIYNLRIEVDHPPSAGKAHVIARFENLGRTTTVGYNMILEGGAWKVDGIRNGDRDFRQSIDDALKTIGDPDAMKDPVETIYDRNREMPHPSNRLHTVGAADK